MALEFDNKLLADIKKKRAFSKKHSAFMKRMSDELQVDAPVLDEFDILEMGFDYRDREETESAARMIQQKLEINDYYKTQSEALNDCMNFWEWDDYTMNKVLDLQRVNRCKSRFCPNCRRIELNKALQNFGQAFNQLTKRQTLYPYMLTLTVPNVPGELLEPTIREMGKAFSKVWRWISRIDKKGYKKRLFHAVGAVRALEITSKYDHIKGCNMYHPHYHIMIFTEEPIEDQLMKGTINGPFRSRSKKKIWFSEVEMQIMQMWTIAYTYLSIRDMDYMPEWFDDDGNHTGIFMANMQPLSMPDGVYEVFKYFFKDSDIQRYDQFKDLVNAIYRKRLRQGHGIFYGLQLEFEDLDNEKAESIEDFLLHSKAELPITLIANNLTLIQTDYHDYKKISRFKSHDGIDELD